MSDSHLSFLTRPTPEASVSLYQRSLLGGLLTINRNLCLGQACPRVRSTLEFMKGHSVPLKATAEQERDSIPGMEGTARGF